MSVRFLCSACGTSIKAKDEYSGKSVRCPHCRERILVPPDDQPNDVLEIGEDYGLAAMSVGEIEIDSPEMHAKPSQRPGNVATAAMRNPMPIDAPIERRTEVQDQVPRSADPGGFLILQRASLGLLIMAICSAIVFLYVLGGELVEYAFGEDPNTPQTRVFGSPLLDLVTTFIAAGTIVCLLAGASDALRVLLDIRNILNRSKQR